MVAYVPTRGAARQGTGRAVTAVFWLYNAAMAVWLVRELVASSRAFQAIGGEAIGMAPAVGAVAGPALVLAMWVVGSMTLDRMRHQHPRRRAVAVAR